LLALCGFCMTGCNSKQEISKPDAEKAQISPEAKKLRDAVMAGGKDGQADKGGRKDSEGEGSEEEK
jgi:hypothetical protein